MESVMNLLPIWGMRVLGVLIALFIANFVSKMLAKAFAKTLQKREFDQTLTDFFSSIVRYSVLTIAVIGCLGVFGIQTTSFAAVLAAMGLAVGMALQGTLGNFAAGVMLLVFRPFKIGDAIKVAGHFGIVEELQLFTTNLKTPDNRRLVVPNGQVFGHVIENISYHDTRRVDVPVGVSYDVSIAETKKVLEKVVAKVDNVLEDPAPQIFLSELGGSSVDWQLRLWTKSENYWDVYQQIIQVAKDELDAAKIGIPYPQMDVHFDGQIAEALIKKAS